jgi:hypothetical protein
MKNRPLIFILIAMAHLIEPLIKLLVFKAKTGFSFNLILSNVFQMGGPWAMAEFWLLFPIGGLALIGVKKWSYPIFVGVQIYSVYGHLTYKSYTWPYIDKYPHWFSLLVLAANIAIIAYFMLPDVRRPFFDKEARWWEHRVRYPCQLTIGLARGGLDKLVSAPLLNISLSGAFVHYAHHDISVGELVQVHMSAYGENVIVLASVVSRHEYTGLPGLGLKFNYQNLWENLAMRKIIRGVALERKKKKITDDQAMAA